VNPRVSDHEIEMREGAEHFNVDLPLRTFMNVDDSVSMNKSNSNAILLKAHKCSIGAFSKNNESNREGNTGAI
jgi:hypothetical protein